MNEFLAISRLLTGLSQLGSVVSKSVEERMAKDYLRLMMEQFGPGFQALLAIYRSVAGQPDVLKALTGASEFQGLAEEAARQIVILWMLSQYRIADAGKTTDFDAGFFEKGFVWPAIQAHPIGFSHRSYGYWADKP